MDRNLLELHRKLNNPAYEIMANSYDPTVRVTHTTYTKCTTYETRTVTTTIMTQDRFVHTGYSKNESVEKFTSPPVVVKQKPRVRVYNPY